MANLLNNYDQGVVSKGDYLDALTVFSNSHYRRTFSGDVVSWLDENLDPFSGEWLSLRILEDWGWPEPKGGRERGKDYTTRLSTTSSLPGLQGSGRGTTAPWTSTPWFRRGNGVVSAWITLYSERGRSPFSTTGTEAATERGGLSVFVDGKLKGNSRELAKLSVEAL
jgi:hypothetical protein